MRDSKDTRPRQSRGSEEDVRNRLTRNLMRAFPVEEASSFAGLLRAIDDAEQQQRA